MMARVLPPIFHHSASIWPLIPWSLFAQRQWIYPASATINPTRCSANNLRTSLSINNYPSLCIPHFKVNDVQMDDPLQEFPSRFRRTILHLFFRFQIQQLDFL